MNDYVLETLMTFDAEAAELESEPDEEDGPPVLVELVAAKSNGATAGSVRL